MNVDKSTLPPDFLPFRGQPRSEQEITAKWAKADKPVVSICCATYNHVNWIEDAILGFLAQETTFPFEIIIRDDASTDGTTEVIKKYASLYPNILRAVINETNRYQLGERPSHVWGNYVRGSYIALCEGDDYWISEKKLAKQVELLEKTPNAVMSFARTHVCKYDHTTGELLYSNTTGSQSVKIITSSNLDADYYHTSTYLIKVVDFFNVVNKFFLNQSIFGDTALRSLLIDRGPFVCLTDVVSVYRVTGEGIWSSLDQRNKLLWEYACAKSLLFIMQGDRMRVQKHKVDGILISLLKLHMSEGDFIAALKLGPLPYYLIIKKFAGKLLRALKLNVKL